MAQQAGHGHASRPWWRELPPGRFRVYFGLQLWWRCDAHGCVGGGGVAARWGQLSFHLAA
eukprot:7981895-Alexandrium_andersonii.AAC.1